MRRSPSQRPSTELLAQVRDRIQRDGLGQEPAAMALAVRRQQRLIGADTVLSVVERLQLDSQGAGVLQPFLNRADVTDVLVNGAESLWIDSGTGLERQSTVFSDESEVRRLAQRLASLAGRRLDDASCWVDGRLPDGTRLHAVLSPLAKPGTLISLRRPSRLTMPLADLEQKGDLSKAMASELRSIIKQRRSFLVTGATGSGKTTMLSALLAEVPSSERIVIVEDSAELYPVHSHVVSLEGRPANVEGVGLVTMRDLIRQSLRMRPDRLIVGEVRGPEVADMLAAMNTGHEGGAATVHANSPHAVPARLAALGASAGLDREATWLQAASAIDVIVHVGRDQQGRRCVRELADMTQDSHGELRVHTYMRANED